MGRELKQTIVGWVGVCASLLLAGCAESAERDAPPTTTTVAPPTTTDDPCRATLDTIKASEPWVDCAAAITRLVDDGSLYGQQMTAMNDLMTEIAEHDSNEPSWDDPQVWGDWRAEGDRLLAEFKVRFKFALDEITDIRRDQAVAWAVLEPTLEDARKSCAHNTDLMGFISTLELAHREDVQQCEEMEGEVADMDSELGTNGYLWFACPLS